MWRGFRGEPSHDLVGMTAVKTEGGSFDATSAKVAKERTLELFGAHIG